MGIMDKFDGKDARPVTAVYVKSGKRPFLSTDGCVASLPPCALISIYLKWSYTELLKSIRE